MSSHQLSVQDATRKVNGFWLVVWHNDKTNGKSLDGTLKDSSGKILATTKVAPASQCLKSWANRMFCRDWIYASFWKTVSLEKGKKYYMDFSGPTGAWFTVITTEITYYSISVLKINNIKTSQKLNLEDVNLQD
jgi:hypothetical protein